MNIVFIYNPYKVDYWHRKNYANGMGSEVYNTSQGRSPYLNTLRPRQNGRQFPDDIFKCIFLNENM